MLPLRQQERAAAGARLRRGDDPRADRTPRSARSRPSWPRSPRSPTSPATSASPARSTSTAWCGTTTCGRCRIRPRSGSTSSARSTATAQSHAHRAAAARPPDRARRASTRRGSRSSSCRPGPPVLSSLVAEVYGRPDHSYDDLIAAAGTVADRLASRAGGGRGRRHGRGGRAEARLPHRPGEGRARTASRSTRSPGRSGWSWPAARRGRSGSPASGTRCASSCGCRGRSARAGTTWRRSGSRAARGSSRRSPSSAAGRPHASTRRSITRTWSGSSM